MQKYGLDYVLNMDETPCKIVERPLSGWALGASKNLRILTDGNTRQKITVIPTITAGGDKLNMAWIHKAETTKAISEMDNVPKNVLSYFSESGWINSGIMMRCLREVVAPYVQKRKCALLIDSYEAHWTDEVKDLAKKMKVELIKVPEGTTSELQPMDVHFNGPFKAARTKL